MYVSSKQKSLIDQSQLDTKIKVLVDVRNPDICLSVRLSPDGKYFAVALANGKVYLYNTKNDKLIYKLNDKMKSNDCSATAVRFRPWGFQNSTPNNILIATFTDGTANTYHFPSLSCVHKMNEGRDVLTCEYSSLGDTFATSGSDGILRIYDDETRKLLACYAPSFYEKPKFRRIYSIAYHPINTDELITGGWDDVIRYYDLRIPQLINKLYGPHICGEGLDFSRSGREVTVLISPSYFTKSFSNLRISIECSKFCSASWRKNEALQIWDYGSLKLIKSIDHFKKGRLPKKGITSSLNYCCKYFTDNQVVVGGTLEDALSIVNTFSGETQVYITGLQKSVYSVDSYESKVVFVAGQYVSLVQVF